MLSKENCEACQTGAPQVSDEELPTLRNEIPDWNIEIRDGVMQLERGYTFKNFKLAMEFANKLADLAEQEFHHPGILVEWGSCTVTWWTHAIKGLHRNDFIMAARTDELLEA